MNQGAFLMRGLDKVPAEFSLAALAYNLRRAINLIGVQGRSGQCRPDLTPKYSPPGRPPRLMGLYQWPCAACNPQPLSLPSSSAFQARHQPTRVSAQSGSFLGKLAGQRAGPRLITSPAANMYGWQKMGSRKEAANDRMWVLLH